MKKMMIAAAMALLLFAAVPAQAESHGSTFLPMVYAKYVSNTNFVNTQLVLSNITGKNIECSVKVYDGEGNDVSSNVVYQIHSTSYGSGGFVSVGTEPDFSIPSYGTRVVVLKVTSANYIVGHAIIKWTCEDENLGEALLGSTLRTSRNGANTYAIASEDINGGQPF